MSNSEVKMTGLSDVRKEKTFNKPWKMCQTVSKIT